jgi:hypothetical protein
MLIGDLWLDVAEAVDVNLIADFPSISFRVDDCSGEKVGVSVIVEDFALVAVT